MAVEYGAAQEPLDYVALLLWPWDHFFMDGQAAGADVVGDAAEAAAVVAFRIVFLATDFAGGFDERAERVDMKIRFDALHDRGHALQAHAGIDVFAGERAEIFRRVADAVELREDEVPDFDFAAAGRMKKDFAARAADSVGAFAGGAGGPEVIVFAHPLNAVGLNFDLVAPDVKGLVVVEIDGDGESLGGDAHPFFVGEEFPGPVDGVFLEVIAEAEVAQHLEKRVMKGGAADVIDIARAEAFLARRGAGEFEFALAEEVIFELVHAGRREQDGGIPARDEHVAGAAHAAFGLEKFEILFADFVGLHGQ